MKNWLFALLLALPGVAWAQQNASELPLRWHDIGQGRIYDTLVIDSGGVTWIEEADLTQIDGYWLGGRIKVVDVSCDFTDSVRDITGFYSSQDSVKFATLALGSDGAADTLHKGDSVEISIAVSRPMVRPPDAWVLDSASVDTSEIFLMTPGASITSTHLIEVGDNQDSADTKIVLQIALSGTMPNNQVEWWRIDSINTYTTQDTVQYKAWGAKQATLFRFILDPTEAPFSASHTATHYGRVLVDK